MDFDSTLDETVLLTLQNNSKPDQIVYLVLDKLNGYCKTKGLSNLFGVKEIRIESTDMVESLPEYAGVLSFLFETMSAAEELKLPYSFQNEFEYGNARYTIYDEGDYRVLKRADEGVN